MNDTESTTRLCPDVAVGLLRLRTGIAIPTGLDLHVRGFECYQRRLSTSVGLVLRIWIGNIGNDVKSPWAGA